MESINMVVSGIVKKDGKNYTHVSFLRGSDFAEGTVPDGIIKKSAGFTSEELVKLQDYLIENQTAIMEQAKKINPLRSWLGKGDADGK